MLSQKTSLAEGMAPETGVLEKEKTPSALLALQCSLRGYSLWASPVTSPIPHPQIQTAKLQDPQKGRVSFP